MERITLYTRPGCQLCDEMKAALERLGYQVTPVNIDEDRELKKRYGWDIPVAVAPDGRVLAKHRLPEGFDW
jgi:hypothetical protein